MSIESATTRCGSRIGKRTLAKRRRVSFVALALTLASLGRLSASDLPPWRDADDMPLPDGARSVLVQRNEQAIQSGPMATASRRGTALLGARLPLYGAKRGVGCTARWILVGAEAWICQDGVALDGNPPLPPRFLGDDDVPSGLPYRYYFVGGGGTNGYFRLNDAEDVAPDRELEPGFAVAVVDEGVKAGARYLRTHHGLWIPAREVAAVAPFAFHGEEVTDGKLDFAWILDDRTAVLASPGAGARPAKSGKTRSAFQRVEIFEEKPDKSGGYLRIGDGEWIRGRDARRPALGVLPASLRPNERWIDIDLATQTLLALEGERPVYATLVSTGKGKEGTDTATPRGEFRIWVKLVSSNMDNLEDEEAERYYAIEDVPYVQFFAKGVGLHGAFWHRGFGRPRSHGCVNLAPLDAQRLFSFTGPRLPAGWTAVLPTSNEEGTLVRVR